MFHLTTALDAASGVPLYEQLYESLAAEMRSGAIPAGTRMPGKRRLAAELSVSVNTVDAAYQILATEGYMEPRERSGPRHLPLRRKQPSRPSGSICPPGAWTRGCSRSAPGPGCRKSCSIPHPSC